MNLFKRILKWMFAHNCENWKHLYSIRRETINGIYYITSVEYKCGWCGKKFK